MKIIKKALCLFALASAIVVCNNAYADDVISSVKFCDMIEVKDVTVGNINKNSVNISRSSLTCNVEVALANSNYTVESGNGSVTFKEGANDHTIVVKDATGNSRTYVIPVNYTLYNGSNTNTNQNSSVNPNSNNNPSTGDSSIQYICIALGCAALIAISYEMKKKNAEALK